MKQSCQVPPASAGTQRQVRSHNAAGLEHNGGQKEFFLFPTQSRGNSKLCQEVGQATVNHCEHPDLGAEDQQLDPLPWAWATLLSPFPLKTAFPETPAS